MKKFQSLIYFAIIVGFLLLTGCATTPSVQIWQPWTRVLDSYSHIPLNSKIKISVEGDTNPLLGDNLLLQNNIEQEMKLLLERRGYKIVSDGFQFLLILKYKTERYDKVASSSLMYSSNNNTSASLSTYGSLTTLGLGVSIAQTISAFSNKSNVVSQNIAKTIKSYTHSISIEIMDTNNQLIWQGESTWDSPNLNLQSDSKPSIQLIVSNLPDNKEILPVVSKVKKDKERNYYNLVCNNKWFSCPALPYRIKFGYGSANSSQNINYNIPYYINDSFALSAYVDLMQTAEYALPLGLKDYSNPLDDSLWRKVQLGGAYKFPSGEEIKILINLKGEKSGYLVDKCWIASNEEFEQFEKNLNCWRNSLIDYYDVFE
jgi:hypothetical protein